MSQLIVLSVLLFHSNIVIAATAPGCQLNLNKNLPTQKDPVYLVKNAANDLLLAMPQNGNIVLAKQQDLILACTGGKNTLTKSGKEVTTVSCVSGQTLKLGSKNEQSKDLVCNQRSAASLLITTTTCTRNSITIQSGFKVENKWFNLIESCHDKGQSNTYWSRHILYGSQLAGKVIQNNRPGFSRGDKSLYQGFNPDESYSWNNQKAQFEKIYGKKKASQYLNQGQSLYLARGHLAPDADFLFSSWQMATYFFVNAVPKWQSINNGNWYAVENNARKVATNLKADLTVVTGTYGQLKLADEKGVIRAAALESNNKLSVPEYVWKLLANPKDNSCIVFISTNNPFLTAAPPLLCKDICSQAGWPTLQNDFKKGYIYCCDYNTFNIPSKPPANCKYILRYK